MNDENKVDIFADIIPKLKRLDKMLKNYKGDWYIDLSQFAHLKPFQIEGIGRMLSPYIEVKPV
jgi:hypothetical protein